MSKEIEVITSEVLDTPHIEVTPYGIEFDLDHSPTIEEWRKAVVGVQKVHGMMQFYLGDLMIFAESPVTGWGDSKYADLIESTGYEYNTLKMYASISRRFSLEQRKRVYSNIQVSEVTFAHFQLVASLDDERAMYFLERVAEGRWTVKKLREEILKAKGKELVVAEDYPEQYIPTLAQRMTNAWKTIRDYAKENEAQMIRIQVIKDNMVIEEELVEL